MLIPREVCSYFGKKVFINFISSYRTDPYSILSNFCDKGFTINKINLFFARLACFLNCGLRKRSGCNQDTFFNVG